MTINSILTLLQEVDSESIPNLSEKVKLEEFAIKIYGQAHCEFLEDENGCLKGLVVGYANDCETHASYISLVAVNPYFRKQGIAKKLLRQFLDYAIQQQFINTVGIHSNNPIAIRLYQELGFKIIDNNTERKFLKYTIK